MLILLLFAFIAGFVTILSPCILPILPIVLSGSLTGGKKRPVGIVTGFIASFTFFTLALATLVKATGLSADALRSVAVITIGLFGLSLLIPQTQAGLEKLFTKLSGFAPRSTGQEGFWGGTLIGLSLGLVWAPCVGPILASVITLAITANVSAAAVLITLAYSLGTGIPMLLITYGGRKLLTKVPWLLSNTAKIQRIFGVLMILTAAGIYFNIDRKFQALVLETFPQYGAGLTSIEDNSVVRDALEKLDSRNTKTNLKDMGQAPELSGYTAWINATPLTLEKELKGKVVLVDFWTYTCINCIRTLPYLKSWHEKYKDKGLVIVGVHAPEFEFEKKKENVVEAMNDFKISYPVVLDNDFKIWTAYRNQYWPAKYLIDKEGVMRYTHFGEGKYEETERMIQQLLGEEGPITAEVKTSMPLIGARITEEIYLGFSRASHYSDSQNKLVPNSPTQYGFKEPLGPEAVGLRGPWIVEDERITSAGPNATLSLNFFAKNVYLVLTGNPVGNASMKVKLDGKEVSPAFRTSDYDEGGAIGVSTDRKYDLLKLEAPGRHTIELSLPEGMSAYAFTFGL